MPDVLKAILDESNIQAAISHVISGRIKLDAERMPLNTLPAYWLIHRDDLRRQIIEGEWNAHTIVFYSVLTRGNGRPRRLARLSGVDLMLHRAVAQILTTILEPLFSHNSYAYRTGRSHEDAIITAREQMSAGRPWVLRLDIRHYFDEIDLNTLLLQLAPLVDPDACRFLSKLLRAPYRLEGAPSVGEGKTLTKGLPQGSPLSPLLSNLYLNEFDHWLPEHGVHHVRFADDITCFFETAEDARRALPCLADYLREHLHLELNREKCQIVHRDGLELLGYRFCWENGMLMALPTGARQSKQGIAEWNESPLLRKRCPTHLLADGILTKQDMALLYEGDAFRTTLPTANLKTLHIHADVICAPEVMSFAFEHGIRICYYNQYGHFIGELLPLKYTAGSRLGICQAEAIANKKRKMDISIRLMKSIAFNRLQVIRYYRKHGRPALESIENGMLEELSSISSVKNHDELLLCEARIQQRYYSAWDIIIKDESLRFEARSRRPPRNEVNAMISFGNTLLYEAFADEVYRSDLDIRFGFLHSGEGTRQQSLNLDLADILKPMIVDRLIFSLANRRQLTPELFAQTPDNGVYLSKGGKRVFIRAFNDKLDDHITLHGEKLTYRRLIRREVMELQGALEEDRLYHPFHYR